MRILTVGGATQDIIIKNLSTPCMNLSLQNRLDRYLLLQENSKIDIDDVVYSVGGGALNAAVSFSRQNFKVDIACKIGRDAPGNIIVNIAEKEKINTEFITYDNTGKTGSSIVITTTQGNKVIFAHRGANSLLSFQNLPSNLKNYEYLYITSLSGKASLILEKLVRQAKRDNVTVAHNPGISQLKEGAERLLHTLPFIDIFILNSQEAQQFMLSLLKMEIVKSDARTLSFDSFKKIPNLLKEFLIYHCLTLDIRDYFKAIFTQGPKIVVVTHGDEGVYAATKNALYFYPSLAKNIVSTLGAGDSFGSAFVASLAYGYSVPESLVRGIINSASVLSCLDAQEKLLSKSELDEIFSKTFFNLVEEYPLNV